MMRRLRCSVAMATILGTGAICQAAGPAPVYVDVAAGIGSVRHISAVDARPQWMCARMAVSYCWRGNYLSAAYYTVGDVKPSLFMTEGQSDATFLDTGLLYGRRLWNSAHGYIYTGAGVARAQGVTHRRVITEGVNGFGDRWVWRWDDQQPFVTIGFPVVVQAMYRPIGDSGIGVTLLADLNRKNNFYGCGFNIGFGIGGN